MAKAALVWLRELMGELEVLDAKLVYMQADRLQEHLTADPLVIDYGGLATHIEHIRSRFSDQLSLTHFYVLDRAAYFEPDQPLFGPDVAAKFPLLAYEVDEAGKCLALRRSTAAVFHLMRTMEIGIRAFARCLNIPDPVKPSERNWGEILKVTKAGIDAKWPNATARGHGDGALFEAIQASLDTVKNPWRNATMHVENKYTDDEAEDIFRAVRGFMKKLASRMDENGEPKA